MRAKEILRVMQIRKANQIDISREVVSQWIRKISVKVMLNQHLIVELSNCELYEL